MARALHAWWLAQRGPSGIPDRAAFDPAAFTPLMPNLMVVDVEPEPFRIRYRLVGTRVAEFTGNDFTGRYLDELIAVGSMSEWQQQYANAYRNRAPTFGSVTEPTTAGGSFTFEFGLFPVSRGGDAVAQFVCVEDYFGANFISAQLQPLPWRKGR
jgi:hypothetical protein